MDLAALASRSLFFRGEKVSCSWSLRWALCAKMLSQGQAREKWTLQKMYMCLFFSILSKNVRLEALPLSWVSFGPAPATSVQTALARKEGRLRIARRDI